ncbi:MAG TPA: hypothetical protein VFX02_07490 [Gammaproteobacteria bacterium]|nr:hypothetical protein [Gammaproteobacteria bacterium]
MKRSLTAFCLLLCCVFAFAAHAERKITANALFNGRAVLMVDNEPVFFATGETQRGITLVSANENRAIVKVDGEEITLYLDKGVAEKYAKSQQAKQLQNAKSHIIAATLMHQTSNIATFEVEYFYNKDLGEHATLSAGTLQQNKTTGYWSHTYTVLTPGRNTATISVSMSEKAPASYNSDAIRFDINWVKGEQTGSTGTLVIPFIKTWKQ